MEARQQLLRESRPLLRRRVLKLGKRNLGFRDVVRIEARIDRRDQRKAADQEAARNQEHHRQRYLCDRQDTSHMPAAMLASTLAALFEVRLQVGRGCEQY